MPQAAIPYIMGASAIASAVDGNIQNKATIKNEENARAGALEQTQKNQNQAFGNLSAFNKANPGPLAPQQGTPTYNSGAVPIVGQQPGQPDPKIAALISQIMQQRGGAGA